MKIEHFAINVAEPAKMAEWYVKHLGMHIVKSMKEAPFMHFLADKSGDTMIELYTNPPDQVPDYQNMDPLLLHLAFVTDHPQSDKEKLITAGASEVSDTILDDGSLLIMLRDPWGLALQLCRRSEPMLLCQQR